MGARSRNGPPTSFQGSATRRRRGIKVVGPLVKFVITLALIGILVNVVDLETTMQLLLNADITVLFAALVLLAFDRTLMIGKWYPLVRVQLPSISLWRATRVYLASGFAAIFLPSTFGADLVRGLALGRTEGAVAEVGASVVMERMLGMIAVGFLSLAALVAAMQASLPLGFLLPWAIASVGIAVAACLAPLSKWVAPGLSRLLSDPKTRAGYFFRRFTDAYLAYRHRPRMLLSVGILTLIENAIAIPILWLLARAVHSSISFEMLLVAVPLTLFVIRLPIAVWSLGVTEGALVYLLGLYGVPPAEALAVALVDRLLLLVIGLLGAPFWWELVRPLRRIRQDKTVLR